jgi:hypothetical protein
MAFPLASFGTEASLATALFFTLVFPADVEQTLQVGSPKYENCDCNQME